MKPVFQTIFGDGSNDDRPGNCLQACIASILELSLDEVPHFVEDTTLEWHNRMNKWLINHAGVYALNIDKNGDLPVGYALLNGESPRGLAHSVVIYNGEIVHDPHPDGGGADPGYYTVFVSPMYSNLIHR